jgi:outer membrane protein assembly factor BamB
MESSEAEIAGGSASTADHVTGSQLSDNVQGTDGQAGSTEGILLWPAIAIVASMWLILIVPGMIAPLTKLHFTSMQSAPALGAILLSVWWFRKSLLPKRKRVVGLVALYSVFVIIMFAIHPSLRILMLIKGLPAAMTLLVVGFVIGQWVQVSKQAWFGVAAFAGLLVGALFVRVGTIDAAFDYTLVPRWKPTAEQELLQSLKNDLASGDSTENVADSVQSTGTPRLPDQPGSSDWAEFRGPRRDGILDDVVFETDWSENPPAELWRRPVGPAWSSFCVVGPWFFTQEQRGKEEIVSAYRVDDGSSVWSQSHQSRFEASMGGVGPRATPTYHQQRLYVMGGSGLIQCLDAATGDCVWKYDLMEELDVPLPSWGFASSPLIFQNLVIAFAGGGDQHATVALDKTNGALVWSAAGGNHGYSSPQLSTIHETEQVLISSNRGLQSLEPHSGKELWNHEWDIDVMARVTQPTVVGNTAYLGTGYGNGTRRIDITRNGDDWQTEEIWTKPMKPYFNDCVYHQGFLYGFDGPIFMCLDAKSGKKAWKRGRYGHGQVLLVQAMEMLLILTEKGKLVLAKTNPKKLEEIATIPSVEGITWNHPVVAGGKLFVRNANEMVAYDLNGKANAASAESDGTDR